MRRLLLASAVLLFQAIPAHAQISVGIGINTPGMSIGLDLPAYPELVRVPGYPVYYAPSAGANLFFYDGLYWVYQADNWYASSWYNGPWRPVGPDYVPFYVLRVPVRYYRQPPAYFRGWRADSPPRWGDHWGHDWEQRREGWDRWDRHAVPPPAPLPSYQRRYAGEHYPRADEQQRSIRSENYRYQPHEDVTRQHFQPPGDPPRAADPRRQEPARPYEPTQPAPRPHADQPYAPPPSAQHPAQDQRSQPGRGEGNGPESKPPPGDKSRDKGSEDRGPDRQ